MRLKIALGGVFLLMTVAAGAVPIKDIASIAGMQRTVLVGYGLVIGLNGSGDRRSSLSERSLNAALMQMGVSIPPGEIKSRNVAAVMVTGALPPFYMQGQPLSVTVSSIGDARSLEGGVLLRTLLKGPRGDALAVIQGSMMVGAAPGGVSKGNVAHMSGSGVILESSSGSFHANGRMTLALNHQDFATALSIQETVRLKYGVRSANALDSGRVEIVKPSHTRQDWVSFAAAVQALEINPGSRARVVYDPRSGALVFGGSVRLQPAAVSLNGIDIRLEDEPAETQLKLLRPRGPTLQDLITALNALKASPTDITALLNALKRSGMLMAELEIL